MYKLRETHVKRRAEKGGLGAPREEWRFQIYRHVDGNLREVASGEYTEIAGHRISPLTLDQTRTLWRRMLKGANSDA